MESDDSEAVLVSQQIEESIVSVVVSVVQVVFRFASTTREICLLTFMRRCVCFFLVGSTLFYVKR